MATRQDYDGFAEQLAVIEKAGRALVPLALQPRLEPIEMTFFKLIARLGKAAERTIHGLSNAIGRIVDLYSRQECSNYFAAAEYDAD